MITEAHSMKDIRSTFEQWEAQRPDLDLSTLYFKITVLRLGKAIEDEFDRSCRIQHDLRANDVRVLFTLRRAGKPYMLRPTDIFQSLLITAGAVTKQVDRLSSRGLVKRKQDPSHAGGTLVQLTPKGITVSDEIAMVVSSQGKVHEAMENLSKSQQNKSLDFLLKLLDEFNKLQKLA
jgi:DNA-binding MarR family transcriptional regulator